MEAKARRELSCGLRFFPRYRDKFEAAGWEFGLSILDLMRCPCSPKDAKPNPGRAMLETGLVEILEDDEEDTVNKLWSNGFQNAKNLKVCGIGCEQAADAADVQDSR
jgi:hypothetical protein